MNEHTCPPDEVVDPAVLNNDGVTKLLMGQGVEAVLAFKRALIALKTSLVQIPDHTQRQVATSPNVMYVSVGLPVCEERYYIFSRAWIFPPIETGMAEKMFPLHSSLILFNIGLAYHIRSLEGSNGRLLRDAYYFYTVSLQLLSSVPTDVSEHVIAPLELACQNNLAIVHYERGDAREAHSILKSAFARLTSTMNHFDEDDDTFDDEVFDGITLNALMVKWTYGAPCA